MVFNMEAKSLEEVPVVNEYPDVFPEKLPGMPPDRDIEFVIDFVPGTRSMENSMSRYVGIPGSSSGKTSGYSFTIGTPSKVFTSILKTIGSGPLPRV